jgi:hypothetical protein
MSGARFNRFMICVSRARVTWPRRANSAWSASRVVGAATLNQVMVAGKKSGRIRSYLMPEGGPATIMALR